MARLRTKLNGPRTKILSDLGQTYEPLEFVVTCIWMLWVLVVGIVEALIHIVSAKTYLIVYEDEWKVEILIRQ